MMSTHPKATARTHHHPIWLIRYWPQHAIICQPGILKIVFGAPRCNDHYAVEALHVDQAGITRLVDVARFDGSRSHDAGVEDL
jgi:hypothetical protein